MEEKDEETAEVCEKIKIKGGRRFERKEMNKTDNLKEGKDLFCLHWYLRD